MRTPGHDFELAGGLPARRGRRHAPASSRPSAYCAADATPDGSYNVVTVADAPVAATLPALDRNFLTTSACGLCGKASLDALRDPARRCRRHASRSPPRCSYGLPDGCGRRRGLRHDGRAARGRAVRPDGRLIGAPGGRRPAQRGRQAGRLGAAGGPAAAGRARAAWSAGGPASRSCRRRWPGARSRGGGVGAVLAGGRAGRGARHDARRVPARGALQRVHGTGADICGMKRSVLLLVGTEQPVPTRSPR